MAWLWLAVTVFFLVMEASTMALVSIWFALGAFVSIFIALITDSFLAQILVFGVISVLGVILVKPIIKDRMAPKFTPTNADSLVGATGRVEEVVDGLEGTGRVIVRGQSWAAKNVNENEKLQLDTKVKVIEIKGVKLLVEKIKED